MNHFRLDFFYTHIIMTYAYTSCDFSLNQCSWLALSFFFNMHHVYYVFFSLRNSKHKRLKLWSQSHKWEVVKIDWNWQIKHRIESFLTSFFLYYEIHILAQISRFCDQFRNIRFYWFTQRICVIVPYIIIDFVCNDHCNFLRWSNEIE